MYGPHGRLTPHTWLGSIHPRSQCVGGMLLVQWCHKHVLELSQVSTMGSMQHSPCSKCRQPSNMMARIASDVP